MIEPAYVLDCETSGLSPDEDRIIELCIVDFHSSEVLFHSYFNPGCPLPEKIIEITKITDDMLKDAPEFADHYEELTNILFNSKYKAMIGYNVMFDRGMIAGEFRRARRRYTNLPSTADLHFPVLVCAKRMWDNYDPAQPRTLENAYKRFVDPQGFEGAHGARPDTMATLQVVRSQIGEFGHFGKSWIELDPDQKRWWGPSNHVIVQDGMLIWNAKGKYHETPCHRIEKSYWKWVMDKDFPHHIQEMASYIYHVLKDGPGAADQLMSWAYGRRL